jgi:hypothetical protein
MQLKDVKQIGIALETLQKAFELMCTAKEMAALYEDKKDICAKYVMKTMLINNECKKYARSMALLFSTDRRLVEHIANGFIEIPHHSKINDTCFRILIKNKTGAFVELSFAIIPSGVNITLLLKNKAPVIMEFMLIQDNSGLSPPQKEKKAEEKHDNQDDYENEISDIFGYNRNIKSYNVDFDKTWDPLEKLAGEIISIFNKLNS